MIKNYVFDMGNVIVVLNWDKVLDNYELTSDERNILMEKVFESEEWKKLDEGIITKDEAIKIMKSGLPEELHEYCTDIMKRWMEGLIINDEMLDLIKEIRQKGYNTYVLSNAPLEVKEFIENNNLKNLFDGIILSAYEKLVKPNKEIYELLLNRFNIKAEESVFIDDRLDNVQAAKKLGIDAFQFDYKNIGELREYIKI